MRTMSQCQRGCGLLLSPNYSGLIGPEEAPDGLRSNIPAEGEVLYQRNER